MGPQGLNPHMVFEWKTDALLGHIYDGLIGFDPDGELIPALATSWQRLSPTRLRLQLRPDVRFHNGERFDADTVVWNFERIRAMGPSYPRQYLFRGLRAVEKVSSGAVDIVTEFPDNALLHRLAAFSWMIPPGVAEREGMETLNRVPIGTGPYRFVSWEEDSPLRLAAWAGYWGDAPAFEDGIEFHFLPGAEQVRRLLNDSLDFVGEVDPIYNRGIQEAPGCRLVKGDTLVAVNLVFNTFGEAAKDRRVREAVARSIYRPDLIRYVARGNAIALQGGGMKGQALYPGETKASSFSPVEARRLLEGREAEGPLVLRGLLDQEYAMLGKAIQVQLSKVGVQLELETGTREDLFQQVVVPKLTGALNWDKDLFVFACPDPMHHYVFVNSLSNFSEGPFTLWRSPRYDELFTSFIRELDEPSARTQARSLEEISARELPLIPLLQMRKGYALRTSVSYRPTRSGMLDLRQARWSSRERTIE